MARFIPAALVGLVALGLLVGGVSPAWWITALAAVGFALVIGLSRTVAVRGPSVRLSPYMPAVAVGLVAAGLLAAASHRPGGSPRSWRSASCSSCS